MQKNRNRNRNSKERNIALYDIRNDTIIKSCFFYLYDKTENLYNLNILINIVIYIHLKNIVLKRYDEKPNTMVKPLYKSSSCKRIFPGDDDMDEKISN